MDYPADMTMGAKRTVRVREMDRKSRRMKEDPISLLKVRETRALRFGPLITYLLLVAGLWVYVALSASLTRSIWMFFFSVASGQIMVIIFAITRGSQTGQAQKLLTMWPDCRLANVDPKRLMMAFVRPAIWGATRLMLAHTLIVCFTAVQLLGESLEVFERIQWLGAFATYMATSIAIFWIPVLDVSLWITTPDRSKRAWKLLLFVLTSPVFWVLALQFVFGGLGVPPFVMLFTELVAALVRLRAVRSSWNRAAEVFKTADVS